AAAPCGGSQPCRAPLPISRSIVIRHDLIAAYDRAPPSLLRNLSPAGQLCRSSAAIPTPELVNE
ncbi:MAG: hypothetical protein WCC54_15520, partial [Pseudolabrys sp.]